MPPLPRHPPPPKHHLRRRNSSGTKRLSIYEPGTLSQWGFYPEIALHGSDSPHPPTPLPLSSIPDSGLASPGSSTHPACSQGPALRSQPRPWKPGRHTQWYSPPPSYTHWPPFWQGDCEVQMCSSGEEARRCPRIWSPGPTWSRSNAL